MQRPCGGRVVRVRKLVLAFTLACLFGVGVLIFSPTDGPADLHTRRAEAQVAAAPLGSYAAPAVAPDVVAIGEQYIGAPFAYGAEGPYAFDCESFVRFVHAQAGVSIPVGPGPILYGGMWRYGPPQRGDVVGFSEDYSGYITHVGIYAGNGYVLHASTYYGRVVESPMGYIPGFWGASDYL